MPSAKEKTEQPVDNTAALQAKLQELEAKLDEKLQLLQFLSKQVEQNKRDDFFERQNRAQEIRDKSLVTDFGPVRWRVTVPGVVEPVYFNCDEEREQAAIREFENRFGTDFVTNNQRDEDNHKIERVDN